MTTLLLIAGCGDTSEPAAPDAPVSTRRCTVSTTAPACLDAPNQSTFSWIQTNVLGANCGSSSCHGAASNGARIDLRAGASFTNLVNATSMFDPTRKLVVPNSPAQSYLLVLLRHIEPADAEPAATPPRPITPGGEPAWMPDGQDGEPICCQKLDAIQRWIEAGALNN